MYTPRRLSGDERFRLAARLLKNRRALPGGCEDLCGRCDDCLRRKFAFWSRLCEPNSAVYAIENGAGPRAVIIWVDGNEMHGHAWDHKLLDKTEVVNEIIAERLEEYPLVRMTVPTHSAFVARWAKDRLGFTVSGLQNNVYHLWRGRDGIRR